MKSDERLMEAMKGAVNKKVSHDEIAEWRRIEELFKEYGLEDDKSCCLDSGIEELTELEILKSKAKLYILNGQDIPKTLLDKIEKYKQN